MKTNRDLPDDIVLRITSFNDAFDLVALSQTCRRFGSATAPPSATAETAVGEPAVAVAVGAHLQSRTEGGKSVPTAIAFVVTRTRALRGWSLAEESARQSIEASPAHEKSGVSFDHNSSWICIYHELLKLRPPITFERLIGRGIRHVNNNKSHVYISLREKQHERQLQEVENHIVRGRRRARGKVRSEPPNLLRVLGGPSSSISSVSGTVSCSAIGNHIMRAGKHYVTFIMTRVEKISFGIIRPLCDEDNVSWSGYLQFNKDRYNPLLCNPLGYKPDLNRAERKKKWGDSNVHCCLYACYPGSCHWTDWQTYRTIDDWDGMDHALEGNVGLLLDLDAGTLAVYKNNRRLGIMKDGLSGEYSWVMSIQGAFNSTAVQIRRGSILPDV